MTLPRLPLSAGGTSSKAFSSGNTDRPLVQSSSYHVLCRLCDTCCGRPPAVRCCSGQLLAFLPAVRHSQLAPKLCEQALNPPFMHSSCGIVPCAGPPTVLAQPPMVEPAAYFTIVYNITGPAQPLPCSAFDPRAQQWAEEPAGQRFGEHHAPRRRPGWGCALLIMVQPTATLIR